jgi:hypothetical protein
MQARRGCMRACFRRPGPSRPSPTVAMDSGAAFGSFAHTPPLLPAHAHTCIASVVLPTSHLVNPPPPPVLYVGNDTGLNHAEQRTHFALWALLKSPLMIGHDLRDFSAQSLSILLSKVGLRGGGGGVRAGGGKGRGRGEGSGGGKGRARGREAAGYRGRLASSSFLCTQLCPQQSIAVSPCVTPLNNSYQRCLQPAGGDCHQPG